MKGIFSGVRVLDVTRVFSGPFATRMLADYGAEVIKIEGKNNYDDSRDFPPIKNGWSGYFEMLNRNKKGICLDLKDKEDLEKLYKLCREADVFVENWAPLTKHKLKINFEEIKKINPKIIYASLSGAGQDSNKKYYDVIAQAESGLMSLSGNGLLPMKIGPSVVDAFSGMTLAFAISSALYYRQKTGNGQYIDVAMLGCAMNLLENNLIDYSITGKIIKPAGNHDNAIAPFGVFKTKDGFAAIAAGNNYLWKKLENFLYDNGSKADLGKFATNSSRVEYQAELTRLLEEIFSKFPSDILLAKLSKLDIPCSKVNNMRDMSKINSNFKKGFLKEINHTKLGKCIIPGRSIIFSDYPESDYKEAAEIGKDNNEYGI